MSLFTPKPKISASQQQVQSLTRGLYWVGISALVVCMTMTALFGWRTGTSDLDRVLMAATNGLIDLTGALLMSACGVLFAWRYRLAGACVLICASVCIAFSILAIFGFQSSNRVAVAKHAQRVEALDTGQLKWLREQTVEKSLPKGERQSLLGEVKSQIETIKKTGMTPDDEQANNLAPMLNMNIDAIRRWLIMISSSMVLFAQFVCLWLHAFFKHRSQPAETQPSHPSNRNLPPGSSNGTSPPYPVSDMVNPQFRLVPDTGQRIGKFSKAQALRDLQNRLAAGEVLPEQNVLVELYKRPKNTISAWLSDWQDRGLISRTRDGNRKVIGNPPVQSSIA